MIRALRRRHLVLAPAMLILTVGGIIAAARARRTLSDGTSFGPTPGGILVSSESLGVELRVTTDSRPTLVMARAIRPLSVPDPVLYWVPDAPADSSRLPDDAIYLGPAGPQLQDPVSIRVLPTTGGLALWSNGYRRVVGFAQLPPSGGRAR
jgi:hypothetical protein